MMHAGVTPPSTLYFVPWYSGEVRPPHLQSLHGAELRFLITSAAGTARCKLNMHK